MIEVAAPSPAAAAAVYSEGGSTFSILFVDERQCWEGMSRSYRFLLFFFGLLLTYTHFCRLDDDALV
jgi:hypothetical protein